MRFRDRVGLNLCPLIARVALAVSFMWFGFGKFKVVEYIGEDAQILINLGIVQPPPGAPTTTGGTTGRPTGGGQATGEDTSGAEPSPPADHEEASDGSSGSSSFNTERSRDRFGELTADRMVGFLAASFATLQDETSTQPADDQAAEETEQPANETQKSADEGGQPASGEKSPSESAQEKSSPPTESGNAQAAPANQAAPVSPDLKVEAYKFHQITVGLKKIGHPYPVMMARLAVITETAGGILILIGLFSRIWGLGFVVMMCYAFYLTTWPALVQAADPTGSGVMYVWHAIRGFGQLPPAGQVGAMNQLMHFALAWIIVLGGPGAFSLDHAIFGRGRRSSDLPGD